MLTGLLFLNFLPPGRAFALDPAKSVFQFNCRNWTRQSGLPAQIINSVTQTKDGYIWLGTQNGLVRFDGLEFKVVPVDLPQAQGQDIRMLSAAKDGRIFFAVRFGGFGSYDGQKFFALNDYETIPPGLNANVVVESRDGAVWTGADIVLRRSLKEKPGGSFSDETTGIVLSFCEDSAGRIWAGTVEHGLFYWTNGRLAQIPDPSLKKCNIFALAADRDGQIWVGTGQGLRGYDSRGEPKEIPPFTREVKALLVDSHGILWIGTAGMGLARYQDGKFTYFQKVDGLGSDYVTSLFEDTEGSLWVGTREGLSQLTDVKFPIYSSKEGFLEGSSLSVSSSRKEGLWITGSAGAGYFDGKVFKDYTSDALFPNHYIKHAFEARNGDVYFSDGDKNIDVLSGDKLSKRYPSQGWQTAFAEDSESVLVALGESLFRIRNGELQPYHYKDGKLPPASWINNLIVSKDDAIWVSSQGGIFRLKDGSFRLWSATNGLSGDGAQYLYEDEDGAIWAGLATGMARIKDNQVKNIRQENGLFEDCIYSIVPDDHGYFWMVSRHGIFRITRKSLNDFADGKSSGVQSEAFNGLESVKFTDRIDQEYTGCKTPDGRIWFPNPQGVIMIDPANVSINPVAPPVYIESVLANGTTFPRNQGVVVPPGKGELELHFTALSLVAPQKILFRYRLEGYDKDWVEAGNRRMAFYTNLKPGQYIFHVIAANSDGIWNETGDSLKLELRPHYYQTSWFYLLCGGMVVAALFGVYGLQLRHLKHKQQAMQNARDRLEAEVQSRTAELAKANLSLKDEVEDHKRTTGQLEERTLSLEHKIEERKRLQFEIERTHKQLVSASRQAGMAEVATSVLHNVGNVLNSINVSASVVVDRIKKSRVNSLGRLAAMIQENRSNLAAFLTTDPKGAQLPDYLSNVITHINKEQAELLKEMEETRKHIEHIKEIVVMQQSYAKVCGVTEKVKALDLVEDALQLNADALLRHGVELLRDYPITELPEISVERHKVLQILVNVIANAKYACDQSGRKEKRVTVQVRNEDARIRIAVIDNGVGIPAENLTRIFNHGFTTRVHGHGFGLHSGALAAKELGGALVVHSAGPGTGASFTLELPLVPPKPKA